ncbi:hypothetical protein GmRootV59_36800 [Variovorax sp. V59]|uniref:hypothetical protein n=1 Tax=unclassified Variovorax TaxID=663243 RepID=UPI0034E94C81
MSSFNLTIGLNEPTRLANVEATKYTAAPRTNQFEAEVNGMPREAWTTSGRGNYYVYFMNGADLYYVKLGGEGELLAARQKLVVTTDEWEESQPKNVIRAANKARRVKKTRVATA